MGLQPSELISFLIIPWQLPYHCLHRSHQKWHLIGCNPFLVTCIKNEGKLSGSPANEQKLPPVGNIVIWGVTYGIGRYFCHILPRKPHMFSRWGDVFLAHPSISILKLFNRDCSANDIESVISYLQLILGSCSDKISSENLCRRDSCNVHWEPSLIVKLDHYRIVMKKHLAACKKKT